MIVDEDHVEIFPLHQCWSDTFEDLGRSLRRLPGLRSLEPKEFAALAKFIHAVDRLPFVTEGLQIECSLSVDHGSSGAMLSIVFTSSSFELLVIERFDSGIGWDHESRQVLYVEPGYSSREGEDPFVVMADLNVWIREWDCWSEDEAVSLSLTDDARGEFWDQEIDQDAWSKSGDDE